LQNDIRRLSRESAPNVDGWISQAKQLHADIERSRVAARKIIQDHEHGRSLQSNVQDASAKVHLLRGEIQFNDVLINTLGVVQDLDARFSDVKDSLANDHFLEAISRLDEIHSSIKRLGSLKNSRVVRLLEERAADMRKYILEDVQRIWNSLVVVDRIQVLVQIHSRSETSSMQSDIFVSVMPHI
jgi:protein transport protein DSL1/ZW10